MSTTSPASPGPALVLALATDDRADASFTGLAENLDVLRAATDARGRALEVRDHPAAQGAAAPRRAAPAAVAPQLLPGQRRRDHAQLRRRRPTRPRPRRSPPPGPGARSCRSTPCDIVEGGGGIHGITLGQPGGVMRRRRAGDRADRCARRGRCRGCCGAGWSAINRPFSGRLDHGAGSASWRQRGQAGRRPRRRDRVAVFCSSTCFWLAPGYRRRGLRLPPAAGGRGRRRVRTRLPLAWLDTYDFQARPFYERHGYRCSASSTGCPNGHRRCFMRKRLDALSRRPVAPGSSRPGPRSRSRPGSPRRCRGRPGRGCGRAWPRRGPAPAAARAGRHGCAGCRARRCRTPRCAAPRRAPGSSSLGSWVSATTAVRRSGASAVIASSGQSPVMRDVGKAAVGGEGAARVDHGDLVAGQRRHRRQRLGDVHRADHDQPQAAG